jgi:hypothetical protein
MADETGQDAAQIAAAQPWPYRANRPQRYSSNYPDYVARGGAMRPHEDVQGFTAGGMNRDDMARFYFFSLAFDQICKEEVAGDLAELGVYKGHTATLIAAMARRLGRTAWLFDTFEGFSERDLQGIDVAVQGAAFDDTSLEAVRAAVGETNVRFVKGYFPDTANEVPADASFCLVHIDCDLYAPIISSLEFFYPRLAPGGFLIIHDYSSLCWNGAEKAVDEFFADKTEPVIPLPDNAGSVVIRKARASASDASWLNRKRARLLVDEWVSAASGGVSDILGPGWGTPEHWGVWGMGDAHRLHLVLPAGLGSMYELEIDGYVPLLGARTSMTVDVLVMGHIVTTWNYTREHNSGPRSVRFPVSANAGHDLIPIDVELRPHWVARPCDLDPSSNETRPLGVGMHRIRGRFVVG